MDYFCCVIVPHLRSISVYLLFVGTNVIITKSNWFMTSIFRSVSVEKQRKKATRFQMSNFIWHFPDSGPQIAGIESVITYYQQRADGLACILSSDFVQGQPPPISVRRLGSTNTLHRACKQGNFEIAKKILSPETLLNRPDVNGKDAFGSTALHEASFFGHDDIVRLLIKAGAHVLARDTDGATALHRVSDKQTERRRSIGFDFLGSSWKSSIDIINSNQWRCRRLWRTKLYQPLGSIARGSVS